MEMKRLCGTEEFFKDIRLRLTVDFYLKSMKTKLM